MNGSAAAAAGAEGADAGSDDERCWKLWRRRQLWPPGQQLPRRLSRRAWAAVTITRGAGTPQSKVVLKSNQIRSMIASCRNPLPSQLRGRRIGCHRLQRHPGPCFLAPIKHHAVRHIKPTQPSLRIPSH